MAWAPFFSAFFAWSSASKSCVASVTNNLWSSTADSPSSAKRDLADLPLQLLDTPVDLWLVQPERQKCYGLGCCGGEGDGAMPLDFQCRPSS